MGETSGGTKVALIGAAAIVIAALIGILPNILNGPDGPTPTPGVSAAPTTSGPIGTASPSSTSPSPTPPPPPTPTPTPPPPLGFLDRLSGTWTLDAWTEAGGPVTLGIEILNGEMTINGAGDPDPGVASWRMDIQERNEPTTPQPAILCGGQTTLSEMIEGVPGGDTNGSFDWTADLRSIDHSSTGEGFIWRSMCGWAVIGTRAPFAVTLGGDPTQPADRMEMANEYGTFRWSR